MKEILHTDQVSKNLRPNGTGISKNWVHILIEEYRETEAEWYNHRSVHNCLQNVSFYILDGKENKMGSQAVFHMDERDSRTMLKCYLSFKSSVIYIEKKIEKFYVI